MSLIYTQNVGKEKMKEAIFPAIPNHCTILHKIDGNFVLPSPAKSRIENCAFWLLCGFNFDLGGWGFAVPFYSVQDCSN